MARKDLIVVIAGDNSDLLNKLKQVRSEFGQLGKDLSMIGKTLMVGLTAPIVAGFGTAVKVAADFEQQMSDVAAKTGAVGKEFDDLKNLAIELGAKTSFSARQAAQAMSELAQAGFSTKEIMKAMPGLLALAAAGSVDLAEAAAITAAALNGFGLEASESARVADVLAKASIGSATDVTGLGQALKFVAPVAASLGVSLEETVAMIGKLSDAGLDATMAGRSLRSAMLTLLDPSKEAMEVFERLNVAWQNADGSARPFLDIMKDLSAAQTSAADMAKIFAKETVTAALVLKDIVPEIRDYASGLNEVGIAERVAAEKLNNFKGSVEELKGSLETLAIAIADAGLLGWLRDFAEAATGIANSLSKTSPELLKFGTGFALLVAALGPVIWSLGQFLLAVKAVMSIKGPLLAMFTVLATQLGKIPAIIIAVKNGLTALSLALLGQNMAISGAIASLANFGRALVLMAASYIIPAVASLGTLANGFRALGAAIIAGNVPAALTIVRTAIVGFAATISTVLLPVLAAAAAAFVGWNVGKLLSSVPVFKQVGDAAAWLVIQLQKLTGSGAFGKLKDAQTELEFQTTKLAEALAEQGVTVARGSMTMLEYSKALRAAASDIGKVKGTTGELAGEMNTLGGSAGAAAGATMSLTDALEILKDKGKDKLQELNAALKVLKEGLKEGTVSQAQFNEALKVYQEAAGKAAGKTKELKETLAQLIAKGEVGVSTLTALELSVMALASNVEEGQKAFKKLTDEITGGNRTLAEQASQLKELIQSWVSYNKELLAAVYAMNPLKSGLQGVNVAAIEAADNAREFSKAFELDVANLQKMKAEIDWISGQLKDQNLTLTQRAILQAQLTALSDDYNKTLGIQAKKTDDLDRLWKGLEASVRTFGNAVVDVFMGTAELGEAFMTMLGDIARTILDTIVQGALDVMKEAILENVAAVDILADSFKKLFDISKTSTPTPGGGDWKTPNPNEGVPPGTGGLGGGGNIYTEIAKIGLMVFQSFQFAAMNKTLDLIEKETRESKIHLSFILEAMHTYLATDEWDRHGNIKEFWALQLAKMDALIEAVKNISILAVAPPTTPTPGSGPTTPFNPLAPLMDLGEVTRMFFVDVFKNSVESIREALGAILWRLDEIDLNTFRNWFGPELEKQSGILTSIFLQLANMGGGKPVGEYIPNMTLAPATSGAFSVNISGAMKQGQYMELFQREMEAYGIPH